MFALARLATRRRLASLLVSTVTAVFLGACTGGGVGVEGTCVAMVNVDGTFMTTTGVLVPPDSLSVAYVEIARNTGCLDQGERPHPLVHAESNFLDVGTELHRVVGYEPGERLAFRRLTGAWEALTPAPWDF